MGGRGSNSGGVGGGGKIYGGESGTITQKNVDKLIEMGATRWQKGDKDRLYFNSAGDKIVGLETDAYKTGNIRSATLNGEKISNGEATRIFEVYSKGYIDLKTGDVYLSGRSEYRKRFMQALNSKYRRKIPR